MHFIRSDVGSAFGIPTSNLIPHSELRIPHALGPYAVCVAQC